jgi:hypothetical protein
VRSDVPGALVAVAHEPPASVAGQTLLAGFSTQDLLIAAEPTFAGDLTPQQKLKELLVFSVSRQYAELRRALGIEIAAGK